MANPKRRHSHQRTALRRTHYVAVLPEITASRQVDGEPYRLNHNASPEGYWKGRRLPGFKD
ncbi:MAG: 50S ribosomal protein L32 [Armatimonadota bacterium]